MINKLSTGTYSCIYINTYTEIHIHADFINAHFSFHLETLIIVIKLPYNENTEYLILFVFEYQNMDLLN